MAKAKVRTRRHHKVLGQYAKYLKPEERLTIACVDFLRFNAPHGVLWWHTPNEGKRSFMGARIQLAMGLLPGVPDLIILHHWAEQLRVFFVEFKADKYRGLSSAQEAFRLTIERLPSTTFALCRSLDEFMGLCKEWGLVRAKAKAKAK